MSNGLGLVVRHNKKAAGGAPFPAGTANNGLSVDAVTGKIVLGDNTGGVLSTLLSDREIPMAGFSFAMHDGGNKKLFIDNASQIYQIGDIGGANTGLMLFIDEGFSTITLGDANGTVNGTNIFINDMLQDCEILSQASSGFYTDLDSKTTTLGDRSVGGGPILKMYYDAKAFAAMENARFEDAQPAASIASANSLTLTAGNNFIITGNTELRAIDTTNWQQGSLLSLEFTGTPVIKNLTAGGAGTAQIELAGLSDFTADANTMLLLRYDGTLWQEIARKQSTKGGRYTFQNWTREGSGNTVEFGNTSAPGSILLHATFTDTSTFQWLSTSVFTDGSINSGHRFANTLNTGALTIGFLGTSTGTNASSAGVAGTHSGVGSGVYGSAGSSGWGVFGISSSGPGVEGRSTSGQGGKFQSTTGLALIWSVLPASTNTIVETCQAVRFSSGAAANGIGGSIPFYVENDSGVSKLSALIASTWTDVTDATRSGDFQIHTTDTAVTAVKVTVSATGDVTFAVGKLILNTTITAGGTTGNQTINKPSGTVNIAAAGATVTVTNSFCTANSIVLAVVRTNDATARLTSVVPAAGSFVINIVACTAEVSIGFVVIN